MTAEPPAACAGQHFGMVSSPEKGRGPSFGPAFLHGVLSRERRGTQLRASISAWCPLQRKEGDPASGQHFCMVSSPEKGGGPSFGPAFLHGVLSRERRGTQLPASISAWCPLQRKEGDPASGQHFCMVSSPEKGGGPSFGPAFLHGVLSRERRGTQLRASISAWCPLQRKEGDPASGQHFCMVSSPEKGGGPSFRPAFLHGVLSRERRGTQLRASISASVSFPEKERGPSL
uniref:Uncharacterized protein n=1 Tax=Molossus molossus TaxID=27622 RepID=A0A7J8BM86_MOLMO|nr:hypothetical protein HJG59_010117 [Molossus molossus]